MAFSIFSLIFLFSLPGLVLILFTEIISFNDSIELYILFITYIIFIRFNNNIVDITKKDIIYLIILTLLILLLPGAFAYTVNPTGRPIHYIINYINEPYNYIFKIIPFVGNIIIIVISIFEYLRNKKRKAKEN